MTIEACLSQLRIAFPAEYRVSIGFIGNTDEFACQVDSDFGETVLAGNGSTIAEAVQDAMRELSEYLPERV